MYSSVLRQNPQSGNAIIVSSPSGGRPKPTNVSIPKSTIVDTKSFKERFWES